MFAAVILMCGLDHPEAVNTCGAAFRRAPFLTVEECTKSITEYVSVTKEQLPPGVYVSDARCISLNYIPNKGESY